MTGTLMERRFVPSDFAVRAEGEYTVYIEGYAYKFNAKSQDLGGFRERVAEGAGRDSALQDDVRALVDHEPRLVMGRTTAGTLRLSEDSTGLHYEVKADRRQSYVRDLIIALERKDVTQSSFAFRVNPGGESWSWDEDEMPLRTLTSIRLYDVSPVTYPAYLDTESHVARRAAEYAREMRSKREGASAIEVPRIDLRALQIEQEQLELKARALRLG